MIVELDTNLLSIIDNLTINQLVLLSIVLDNNQKSNQGITPLIRLVNDSEIQDLINRGLIQEKTNSKNKVELRATKKLIELITPRDLLFKEFYDQYPTLVTRPDGTKGFLRNNVKKCRDYYNKLVKGNPELHSRIIKALNFELINKAIEGKMSYMKTMWKWLTSHEWELIEEQMNINQVEDTEIYGTDLR